MTVSKRNALAAIFILALALRLIFIYSVRGGQVFLYGDAFNYDGSAIGIIEMFKNMWPNLGFIIKQAMAGSLGKGANVLHPLGIHFSITVFLQGPVYPFFVAAVYAIFGHNIPAVQYAQAVIGAFSCILLFIASDKAFGDKRIAIASALAWALYLPAIYYTELLLTETVGSFVMILLIIALLHINEKNTYGSFLLCGIITAIFMLTKHSFRFLWFFLALALLFSIKASNLKERLKRIAAFVVSVQLLLIPWMMLVGFSTGKAMLLPSNKDYWRELYINNDIRFDGWPPDSSVGATKIEKPSPHKKLFIDNLRRYPAKTLVLYLEKMRRVWNTFINIRNRFFLIGDNIFLLFHGAFVYLGLFGMAVALANWRRTISMIAIVFYTTVLSSAILVEARYNFVVMPIVIIFASYFAVMCADGFRKISKRQTFKKDMLIIAGTLTLFCAIKFFGSIPVIFSVFKDMLFEKAYIAKIGAGCIAPFFIIPAVYVLLKDTLGKKSLLYICFTPAIILAVLQCAGDLDNRKPAEWSAILADGATAYKEIILPANATDLSRIKEVNLLIDMIKPKEADPLITINGKAFLYSNMNRMERFTPGIYDEVFGWRRLDPESIKKWHVMAIPLEYVKGGKVQITVSSGRGKAGDKNRIMIFGDYKLGDGKQYQGPSFARSADEVSFFKLGHDDDYRLPWTERLCNDYTRDYLYARGVKEGVAKDLSGSLGMQSGEYRIRLEIVYKNGIVKTY